MSEDAEEYLTTSQVARLLQVDIDTVGRWARLQQIRAVRLPSGHWRIPKSEVDRLVRQGKPID